MNKGLWRNLSGALAVTLVASACTGGWTKAHTEWNRDEIKELTGATDAALSLVAKLSHGDQSISDLQPAVRQVFAAAKAANARIERHAADIQLKDRLDAHENAAVAACVQSTGLTATGMEHLMEAGNTEGPDARQLTSAERESILAFMAQEYTQCAISLAEYLRTTKSLDGVDKVGAAIGEIYAMALASRAAAGLRVDGLLRDQIVANEMLLARLAPACGEDRQSDPNPAIEKIAQRCVPHRLAADALPKLRSALSRLSTEAA